MGAVPSFWTLVGVGRTLLPTAHTCTRALQFTATCSSGLLAGGAVYTLFVENPAMMTHEPNLAATVWKPSFTRAERLQNILLLSSSVTQLVAYCLGGGASTGELVGSGLVACGATVLCIMPLSWLIPSELLDTERCISKGNKSPFNSILGPKNLP